MSAYIEAAVMGRLAGEVTQRQTKSGRPHITFSIVVSEKGSDVAAFINCSAFEDVAAAMPPDACRGDRIYITGPARMNRWTTKEGQPRANIQVTATTLLAMDRIGRRKAAKPLGAWGPAAGRP
jgi:single-stranded DNA-binding protein